jgi:phosphoglycerate dehydrogenase-like enzyme
VPDTDDRPLVLVTPAPVERSRIFAESAWDRLNELFRVVEVRADDDELLDRLLPKAFAVVGQPDLPKARLDAATALRAILNVEGNFYPNVDYPTAFARGVRVLGCGPAYGQAVAEMAVGLALDLARGISREDRAFRAGRERYLAGRTADSVLLRQSPVGLIGFGNLGRSLLPILKGFETTIRVYDPWLPQSLIAQLGLVPASLEETLAESQFVFVLAAVTDTNQRLLGGPQLSLLRPGARLVLVSRAAVVDFDALLEAVASGRILAAVDVWPEEPMPADHPARSLEGLVLSPHRAGAIPAAFTTIGEMVCDDLELLAAGLPPVRMQAAAPELVGRYRNRPVTSHE